MKHTSWPLDWPTGQPRTPPGKMRKSKFRTLSFSAARDGLLNEVRRFGGSNVVLSTNMPLRRDGMPYATGKPGPDQGVAIYFSRQPGRTVKHYAIACDVYRTVAENMRAITATLEAMRTIERHGSSSLLEQALSGFAELPPASEPEPEPRSRAWWDVLGFTRRPADPDVVRRRWHELAAKHHPDRPDGSREAFELFRRAWEQAQEEGFVTRA